MLRFYMADLFFMDMPKQNVWNPNERKVNLYKVPQHEQWKPNQKQYTSHNSRRWPAVAS